MAEYKGKLLKGLFTQAKNVLLNDGSSVENTIIKSEPFNGITNANGNILTTYDGTKAILGIKINTPSDSYGIPYYSSYSSAWGIRVKKWDDTTLLNTQESKW